METFQDFLFALLTAVITAGVPVVSAYIVSSLKKAAENAKADTDNIVAQRYIEEIATAISDAVAATSQTYVDALKQERSGTESSYRLHCLYQPGSAGIYRGRIRRLERVSFYQNRGGGTETEDYRWNACRRCNGKHGRHHGGSSLGSSGNSGLLFADGYQPARRRGKGGRAVRPRNIGTGLLPCNDTMIYDNRREKPPKRRTAPLME